MPIRRKKAHVFKRKRNKRSQGRGLPGGTLVPHADAHETDISILSYNETTAKKPRTTNLEEIKTLNSSDVHWINVNGLKDVKVLKELSDYFSLHPLLQEDIYTLDHRPKLEEYEELVFVVMKMWSWDADEEHIEYEQVSFVLEDNFLLSFQERPGDLFDPVRERIKKSLGRVRKRGADYLLYALVDVVVDQGFVVVERLSEKISDLENTIVRNAEDHHLVEILELKSLLRQLLHSSNAVRELLGKTEQLEKPFIEPTTLSYFRDVQENALFLSETIMGFRETVAALENTYHAMINMQLNKVVKLLTVISSIFIPLTFIAGIYGMNFDNMPELHSNNGYVIVLLVMAAITTLMLLWFRKKNWL